MTIAHRSLERVRPSGPLTANALRVAYGRRVVLDDVDLTLEPGRFTALTGPSGAGKSTLIWALSGALRAEQGRIDLHGSPIDSRESAVAAGVVLIPQGNALVTPMTCTENIVIPLLAAGVEPERAFERTARYLGIVGLGESSGHLAEELSGGQQQRVAIARGLALEGAVLLADEPTSDLDATTREVVVDALHAQAREGAIVLMATHDAEAAAVADTELHLDEGRLRRVR